MRVNFLLRYPGNVTEGDRRTFEMEIVPAVGHIVRYRLADYIVAGVHHDLDASCNRLGDQIGLAAIHVICDQIGPRP